MHEEKRKIKKSGADIPVLYEDGNIVVFNKPAGIMVHGDGRSTEETLADYVVNKYPKLENVGEPLILNPGKQDEKEVSRPGIVHRLDRGTTGVLVVAKNQKAYENLKKQFKGRGVKKKYRVIVHGHVKNNTGIIDLPIGRSTGDFRSKATPDLHMPKTGTRGALREATTRYKVLTRFFIKEGKKNIPLTYVEVLPETGRTHQIRVHFKSIRHPVFGDGLYGVSVKGKAEEAFGRTALHAVSLSFEHPVTKKPIKVEAPVPRDLHDFLAQAGLL